jgi:hypothetical protein
MDEEKRRELAESIRKARLESERAMAMPTEEIKVDIKEKVDKMNWSMVFYIAAFVCFVLATISVPVPRINLVAAGLALLVAGFVFAR